MWSPSAHSTRSANHSILTQKATLNVKYKTAAHAIWGWGKGALKEGKARKIRKKYKEKRRKETGNWSYKGKIKGQKYGQKGDLKMKSWQTP
jgi:hypothetical protein